MPKRGSAHGPAAAGSMNDPGWNMYVFRDGRRTVERSRAGLLA